MKKARNYQTRCCKSCGTEFITLAYQQLYCNKACRKDVINTRRREATFDTICACCGVTFKAPTKQRRFCTPQCKGKHKYITGVVTTESQYKVISGNWVRYLSRLLYSAGRKRDKLCREDLIEILESQNFKCAISGIPLTCQLERGKRFWTNASVDRIEAGGSYTKENIQLVCRGLNSWRSDIPLAEFIEICRVVAEHNPRGIGGKDGRA